MKSPISLVFCLFFVVNLSAVPSQTTYHIKVDQFGYFPSSRKVAVIADPQVGNNSAEVFNASTAANQYQIRRWDNDAVVFTGTLSAWNGGATQTQSGDRGWYFDFSALTTPGSYYVFDLGNTIGSFRFEISETVYDEVLKQALRTFFYQRINFAKQAPYTDAKWADAICYEGIGQDKSATSRYNKGNTTTAKDLRGGWFDAGDKNKYTTFAHTAVIALIEAYRMNPNVFKDNYNIPESGNGIPDVLDEVKYELDFLKRMQDATGTNGFFLKLGFDNYNEINPPSADTRPRYYLPECTSATLSGMSMFAVAGATLKNVTALSAYGNDLIARAEAAWARAKVTTTNFTTFETACDDGDIKSGDADVDAEDQLGRAFVAAVYLYESTGKAEYKTFAETNYVNVNPYKINWWGPYWMPQQIALLRLTAIPGVSVTVVNNIRNQKAGMNYLYSIDQYNASTDLYRSHMGDDAYHWGHNQARTSAGCYNLDFNTFGINTSNASLYKETAEQYLHWMHGVNPLGMVMLSNMYAYGAEKSANEIYHSWFTDGSVWDNALTSPNGPPPGYVPGGPNKNYTGTTPGIANQPPQKAYKDYNANWPENSWEITENSIYCQSTYIMLLSRLMTASAIQPDTSKPTAPTNLTLSNITSNSMLLSWTASTDNIGVIGYEIYQGTTLLNGNVTTTTYQANGLICNTPYSFSVKAKDAAGNLSSASNKANASTSACTALVTKIIYDEALNSQWSDVSAASTRNFANTTPVQTGIRSISVNFSGNGTLAFSKSIASVTSANTQLQFWVYNNGTNSIRIFTQSADGSGNSTMITTKPARRKWVQITVSMTQLGNPGQIKRVIIQNASSTSTTMYFDNIQLTNIVEPQSLVATNQRMFNSSQSLVSMELFPNPSKDVLNVSIQGLKSSEVKLELIDTNGKFLKSYIVRLINGTVNEQINIRNVSTGNYFIRLADQEQVITKKFIVSD